MSAKQKKPVSTKPTIEIATAKRDYNRYLAYIAANKNPDPILNKTKDGREKGIALYADMKRDCHISACLRRLTLTVTRNPFAVTPAGETPQDIEAAEFIRKQIKEHYYDLVAYILDALPVGFSVTEFWCKITDRVEINQLKKRRQDRFTFNENGELLLKTQEARDGMMIPQEGFIVATYQEEDNNKFGDGILSTCFWPWWMKKHGLLFWANYLERWNQPIALGTIPQGVTDKEQKEEFLAALEAIQSEFAMTMSEGWKVELVKAMDSGAAGTFEAFQGFLDRAISKAILGSAINEGEQKFGSKSSNETLKDISDEVIEAAAEFAAKVINKTLVPRLCDWNVDLEAYPEFAILYKNKKLTKEETEVIQLLGNCGMPIPVDEISDAQGWKIPEKDDLVLYNGKMIAYGDIAKENEKITIGNVSGLPTNFAEGDDGNIVRADEMVIADGKLVDNVFAGTADDLRAAYDEKQLIGLIDKAGDYKAASKELKKYRPKKLEETWREIIELGRWLGEYSVAQQTAGANFAESSLKVETAFDASFRKLKPDAAIAWLKGKVPVKKNVYNQIDKDVKNAAFYVSELEDLELINAVREKMIKALEDGTPFEKFKSELKTASGADPFFGNMKTAFYTNIHQAMAAQDYQALERVKDIIPYRRFSCVIDSATRPEHARWHNFVAPADDPIWGYLYSLLMDFNCRCRITAATESDFNRLADSSAAQRGDEQFPTFDVHPTQANGEKLKELLKVKKGYTDYLDGKLGSWDKIMAKVQGAK